VKTIRFVVIFSIVYMIMTLALGEVVGPNIIFQLNNGLIIGALIWIGIILSEHLK